jgi:hypothetical protein
MGTGVPLFLFFIIFLCHEKKIPYCQTEIKFVSFML